MEETAKLLSTTTEIYAFTNAIILRAQTSRIKLENILCAATVVKSATAECLVSSPIGQFIRSIVAQKDGNDADEVFRLSGEHLIHMLL